MYAHVTKNLYRINFLNSYKNVSYRNVVKENVLVRSTVTKNNTKLSDMKRLIKIFLILTLDLF